MSVKLCGHIWKYICTKLISIVDYSDCTEDASTSPCAITIEHASLGTDPHYDKYNQWSYGDYKLDWYGVESAQGSYEVCGLDMIPIITVVVPV